MTEAKERRPDELDLLLEADGKGALTLRFVVSVVPARNLRLVEAGIRQRIVDACERQRRHDRRDRRKRLADVLVVTEHVALAIQQRAQERAA